MRTPVRSSPKAWRRRVVIFVLSSFVVSVVGDAMAKHPGRGRYGGPRWAAAPPPERERNDVAVGFQLDLFPTVISAVNGKTGYSPQIWAGVKPVRLRLIGAHLEPPDVFTFDERIVDPSLTVTAFTIDYTFGEHFDEVWLGAGIEAWQQRAAAADGSGEGEWQSAVFTVGGGYIWRFAGNLYLDPWLGLHWVLNPDTQRVGDVEYEPSALNASASVKVGWFFWAR